MDGMPCNQIGNVYLSKYGKGVISVIDKMGKLLQQTPLLGKNLQKLHFLKAPIKRFRKNLG